MRMHSRTTRLVIATLIALVAAACGGDDSSGLATLQGLTTTAPGEALTAAGVDEPASGAGATPDSDETEATAAAGETGADETAADETGADETESADEFDDLTDEELLLEFAQCMRDNGVDVPDPDPNAFGPGSGGGGPFGEIDFDDADVSAAFDVCGEQLPSRPGRGGRQ